MSPVLIRNIIRFASILTIQVLGLSRIDLTSGDFSYVHLLIYPYALLLLPINTNKVFSLVIALFTGLFVDMFYNSPGVHASALVFTMYMRSMVINFLEPYEGYNTGVSPTMTNLGFSWFVSYISILLFGHLLFYFSIEAFSFIYFFDILLNTIFSFIPSMILILLLQILFKPKH